MIARAADMSDSGPTPLTSATIDFHQDEPGRPPVSHEVECKSRIRRSTGVDADKRKSPRSQLIRPD
jgi:hypothetical protein